MRGSRGGGCKAIKNEMRARILLCAGAEKPGRGERRSDGTAGCPGDRMGLTPAQGLGALLAPGRQACCL